MREKGSLPPFLPPCLLSLFCSCISAQSHPVFLRLHVDDLADKIDRTDQWGQRMNREQSLYCWYPTLYSKTSSAPLYKKKRNKAKGAQTDKQTKSTDKQVFNFPFLLKKNLLQNSLGFIFIGTKTTVIFPGTWYSAIP